MEAMGKYFPNTPLLAAIVKVAGIMDEDDFLKRNESILQAQIRQQAGSY